MLKRGIVPDGWFAIMPYEIIQEGDMVWWPTTGDWNACCYSVGKTVRKFWSGHKGVIVIRKATTWHA